jgi:RNA polymerase sigma-70 factor (ECF subfamily)
MSPEENQNQHAAAPIRQGAWGPEDWAALVERIRQGDPESMEELYQRCSPGIRLVLQRRLGGQELEDRVQETFLIVLQAIRRGEVREPSRVLGFIWTVVRRQVAAHIDSAVHSRRDFAPIKDGTAIYDPQESPEERLLSQQQRQVMYKVLQKVSRRDREILIRYYLLEQTQEEICSEMNLTETQFRLLKSRAKARFGELGRRVIRQRPLPAVFLRKAAGSTH